MTESHPTESNQESVDKLSFEQAFGELEATVAALEGNQFPLEQALALYERGRALAQRCSSLLDQAELKVQQLSGEELVDFEPPK